MAEEEKMSMEEITATLGAMEDDEVVGFQNGITAHRLGDSWEIYIPNEPTSTGQQFRALMKTRKRKA